MIYLGIPRGQKEEIVQQYCKDHAIRKVFLLSPSKFIFSCETTQAEVIEWHQIIQYKPFYRLLQEIDTQTLVVINECLRTQNRYDLTYNCIRLFLNQTPHQVIFQYLPFIDTVEDFMILFDFDTRSRWKREKFHRNLLGECQITLEPIALQWHSEKLTVSTQVHAQYTREKARLFATLGLKDPHTLPRNLYLLSGKTKLSYIQDQMQGLFARPGFYVGRNNRFKLQNLQVYKEMAYPHTPYTVFEFCHNFIDFVDFLSLSQQTIVAVLVADLKVDAWYMARYMAWAERLADAYTALQ